MYLVLCSASDPSGLWVYEGLRHLGVAPLELVLSEQLAQQGTRWEHRLDRRGTHIKIALPDGRVLCGSRIRGTINRVTGASPAIAQQAAESDREYAQAELHAFYLSWLNSLPGVVINRPSPVGLCGAWYHASEWALRAGRAGLAIRPYRQSAQDAPDKFYAPQVPQGTVTQSFIALGDQVFGGEAYGLKLPETVRQACTRLAVECKAHVLGIELFLDGDGAWTFAGASASPDLRVGGLPLLRQMAFELTGERPGALYLDTIRLNPQLVNPQLVNPQLANPQLANPQLANPQLANQGAKA